MKLVFVPVENSGGASGALKAVRWGTQEFDLGIPRSDVGSPKFHFILPQRHRRQRTSHQNNHMEYRSDHVTVLSLGLKNICRVLR